MQSTQTNLAISSQLLWSTGTFTGVYIQNDQLFGYNSTTDNFRVVANIADGVPHHIVIACDNVNPAGLSIYLDGVAQTVNIALGATPPARFGLNSIGGQDPANMYAGSVQDVAVFNKKLSSAEVSGLYARSVGFLQESSATRVTRLLDDVGWPALWREITTNPRASVGELVYNGQPALAKLQEVADRSEQGRFFITKAGYAAFRERYYANEVTVGNTVQQIFSDDGGVNDLSFSSFQFQFNDVDITNAASVTTPTTRAASSDSTSITAYGLQSKQVDTNLSTFAQADAMAAGIVARGKVATYRVAPILVYPANNTSRWDEVLGLELGYRCQMQITPMAVGSQNVQEVTLEQIEWLITADMWTLTVAGSPAPVSGTANSWFVIGTSLIGSTTDLIGF
jgi:hypothetical protein